jgi:mannan endo-1,4-beta-mannosidase
VGALAEKNKKMAAFTETGLESIPNEKWWTSVLLKSLKMAKVKFAYVLVWRNDTHSATHFYAPFPGQLSAADFIDFYNDPSTLFENDLPPLYRKIKK